MNVTTDPRRLSGLDYLKALTEDRLPHPSMAHTLGFRLTDVGDGRAVISGETAPGCARQGARRGGTTLRA